MDFTFSGATQRQQELFLEAAGLLLNYDLNLIETAVTVSFDADPSPEDHNEFAATTGTAIAIRTDAPDFSGLDPDGQSWGMPFFNEVVAHELCHLILNVMATEDKEGIAAMFDTTPETWEADPAWVDRPLEGICETFKDAFVPQGLRRYSNRTNRTIPIHKYAEFRRRFREALGGGGVGLTDYFRIGGFDETYGITMPEGDGNGLISYRQIVALPNYYNSAAATGLEGGYDTEIDGAGILPFDQFDVGEVLANPPPLIPANTVLSYEFDIAAFPWFDAETPPDQIYFNWSFCKWFQLTDTIDLGNRIDATEFQVHYLADATGAFVSGTLSFFEDQIDTPYSDGRHRITPDIVPPLAAPFFGFDVEAITAGDDFEYPVTVTEEFDSPATDAYLFFAAHLRRESFF